MHITTGMTSMFICDSFQWTVQYTFSTSFFLSAVPTIEHCSNRHYRFLVLLLINNYLYQVDYIRSFFGPVLCNIAVSSYR